jgi:hypothetical protein
VRSRWVYAPASELDRDQKSPMINSSRLRSQRISRATILWRDGLQLSLDCCVVPAKKRNSRRQMYVGLTTVASSFGDLPSSGHAASLCVFAGTNPRTNRPLAQRVDVQKTSTLRGTHFIQAAAIRWMRLFCSFWDSAPMVNASRTPVPNAYRIASDGRSRRSPWPRIFIPTIPLP